tara:strand:+ start:835 stop:1089 length:255 start_codon:yes stop_codon:yes gene_type:complete
MLSRKILKKSKGGTYYIEIDKTVVEELELHVGDTIQLHVEEIWVYDKKKKICTLRGISKECYESLISALNGIGYKNLAKNRESS